jgi:hypothetical protein
MHGGAAGSGAPKGNRNALKHGFYTAAAKARRRRLADWIALCEETLKTLDSENSELDLESLGRRHVALAGELAKAGPRPGLPVQRSAGYPRDGPEDWNPC